MRAAGQHSAVKSVTVQEELQNARCFSCLSSMISNEARCPRESHSGSVMAKAAFDKLNSLFTRELDLHLRMKVIKCYIWSAALFSAET